MFVASVHSQNELTIKPIGKHIMTKDRTEIDADWAFNEIKENAGSTNNNLNYTIAKVSVDLHENVTAICRQNGLLNTLSIVSLYFQLYRLRI